VADVVLRHGTVLARNLAQHRLTVDVQQIAQIPIRKAKSRLTRQPQ
jgi:hypothetical protein